MNIGFEYPALLVLGLACVPLVFFILRIFHGIFVLTVPLGAPGGLPFKVSFGRGLLSRILGGLELSGVVFLFFAAAGPVSRSSERVWLNRGADILFVLDISPSMAGIDMNGRNRFDASRELILSFAENRPSDAIGLVAVGYDAALMVPPTVDRRALYSRLESLQIAELGDGTALGAGLAVAALHLRDSSAPRRAVVLLSDGENNAGAVHPLSAALVLRDLGLSLWVVGIGSGGEIPIDYVDPSTRMRRTGSFDSRFDSESLKAIAQAGEGIYIAAPSGEALTAAFSRISGEERIVNRSGVLIRRRSRHQALIVLALVLLAGSRFLRRCLLGAWA
jgi:Ca-activated chloride channel family protein